MIDDSEYHWRQICAAATGGVDAPLADYPFLAEAMRAVGCDLPPDTTADVVCAACQELMTRRLLSLGG